MFGYPGYLYVVYMNTEAQSSLRDHSFGAFAKFSEKLTFLTP